MKKIFSLLLLCFTYANSFATIQNEINAIKLQLKVEKTNITLLKHFIQLSNKYTQENNDSALTYAKKAFHLANNISDEKGKTAALYQIGISYFNSGNVPEALKHHNQSLIIAKLIDYNLYIAQNYKQIGALYSYEKDYKIALNYQYKALTIFQSIADTSNLAKIYNHIAVYHRELAAYDSSMFYLNLAAKINNRLNNHQSLSFNYNNMANLFLVDKDYDKAEKHHLKSLAIRKKYGLKQDLLQSHNSLGNLFYSTEKYNKAIPYFKYCIQTSKQIKIIKDLPLFYDNLSKTYYKLGNYKLALEHKKNYSLYSDSINSTEAQILMANGEQEIKNAEELYNKLLLQTEVKNADELILKRSILIIILILIAIIALYIINQAIKHYKLQDSLTKKEASLLAIQGTKKVLSEKETAAQKINTAQEILTSEIAALLNTEATLKLKKILEDLTNYKLNNPESTTRITKEQEHINEAIHFINMISTNFSPPVLEDSLLTEVIRKYLENVFTSLNTQVTFTCNNPETINCLEKDLSHNIYRIIQELITNIIKYSEATIVNIEISNNTNHLLLRVQDNGIGFNINTNNKGLGLSNIKHRALLYNGNVIINTKKRKGTEVLINMDYKKA